MTFNLFECRIGIKMTIDEGGAPTGGSLADYVSEMYRLKVAEMKTQDNHPAEESRQPIKYQDLPERFHDLFARFSVIELLEEVRDRFWDDNVLSQQRSSMSVVSIGEDPGIKLESHSTSIGYVDEYETDHIIRAKDAIGNTSESYNVRRKTGSRMERIDQPYLVYVITEEQKPHKNYYHVVGGEELLPVADGDSELADPESDYGLRFLYFRDPRFHYSDPPVPDGTAPPTIDTQITATEPPDTLKRVIGDYLLSRHGNKF